MAYVEKPRPDLGDGLAHPGEGMRTGVNSVASHLSYYCGNTNYKDAP